MTVTEALKVTQRAPKEHETFRAHLACGFTPLHLQLFLNANLQLRLPTRRVEIGTGLFGSLAHSLEDLATAGSLQGVACAVEWADLDPRLGYREGGIWGSSAVRDIVSRSRRMLDRIGAALDRLPGTVRVALALPTLPLPPLFAASGWQASEAELLLEQALADFAARSAGRKGTVVVHARRLAEESPVGSRLDLKYDLATGQPYTQAHADRLAAAFARLLVPDPPKKGVITDLDDTLWHGLVGEVGPSAVSWDLGSHQQIHGLYQKLLASLADAGVLVGIASKNDPAVVEQALRREDLFLPPDRVFPVEVHWEAKSGSVDRILRRWNISADAVAFVDDSPMELAEVAARHPGITCLAFPQNDPTAAMEMMHRLRDLCGKERVSEDDALRLDSIRRSAAFEEQSGGGASPEQFLEEAEAELTFDFEAGWEDARALELVNKTNQFNVNGLRYTEADWAAKLGRRDGFLLVVSYKDRFGPLGKIAVLAGQKQGDALLLDTWVMSCRAFARRIEFQCLQSLWNRFGGEQAEIRFAPTAKNGPARDFFAGLLGEAPSGPFTLTRSAFREKCPRLYHSVTEVMKAPTHQ